MSEANFAGVDLSDQLPQTQAVYYLGCYPCSNNQPSFWLKFHSLAGMVVIGFIDMLIEAV